MLGTIKLLSSWLVGKVISVKWLHVLRFKELHLLPETTPTGCHDVITDPERSNSNDIWNVCSFDKTPEIVSPLLVSWTLMCVDI